MFRLFWSNDFGVAEDILSQKQCDGFGESIYFSRFDCEICLDEYERCLVIARSTLHFL